MSLEGRSRPTHRSNLTDWDKYQAANLVASSSPTLSFPPAIVLQVEESWTNLSTMRASQAKWQLPPLSSPDPKFPQPTPKSQIAASVARIAAKSAHNAGAQAEARRRWSTLEEVSSQARASRSHLHDGVDDGGGAQNAKEVECCRRK